MSVIWIVLPLAIVFAVMAVIAFVRCVRGGQYDDLDTPAMRILSDEAPRIDRAPGDTAGVHGSHGRV